MFLPNYRGWVIVASLVVCLGDLVRHRADRLGAYLRAATENPTLVQAFGINVPLHDHAHLRLRRRRWRRSPACWRRRSIQVNPLMGADLIIVVFAVVVIGGMGSILGLDRHRLRRSASSRA